ncbi:MAG: hypothetical protein HC822_06555, partial [Oscillochloris sp.]|nr:hypothetical protein [Oscillochloris sp.]
MKPAPFRYLAARTIDEAVAALHEHAGEARVLAGGQSLVPLMNMRLATPEMLVDINRIADLEYVRAWDGGVAIGAMTRDITLEHDREAALRLPLLVEASACVGHPAIRNRSTVGGSIAQADPAAELPAVMMALDAQIVARGPSGERTITAADFFSAIYRQHWNPMSCWWSCACRGCRPAQAVPLSSSPAARATTPWPGLRRRWPWPPTARSAMRAWRCA